MSSIQWITDRLPTEADGDGAGEVILKHHPRTVQGRYVHWSCVGLGCQWRHLDDWPASQPPILDPAPQPPALEPRRFVSISRTIEGNTHYLDAIDDEGVAWMITDGSGWRRWRPLPDRDVINSD